MVLWLLGVILIPAGIATWFAAMMLAFDGGGAWTGDMAIAGLVMIPVGLLAKVAIGIYLSLGRNESIPVWYWSDFMVIGGLAVVMAAVSAWDSARPAPPPPPAVVPPLGPPKVVENLEDVAALQILKDGRVRLRSGGARMGLYDPKRRSIDRADMIRSEADSANEISLAIGETGAIWDGRDWRFLTFRRIDEGRALVYVWWMVRPAHRIEEELLVGPYGP